MCLGKKTDRLTMQAYKLTLLFVSRFESHSLTFIDVLLEDPATYGFCWLRPKRLAVLAMTEFGLFSWLPKVFDPADSKEAYEWLIARIALLVQPMRPVITV